MSSASSSLPALAEILPGLEGLVGVPEAGAGGQNAVPEAVHERISRLRELLADDPALS